MKKMLVALSLLSAFAFSTQLTLATCHFHPTKHMFKRVPHSHHLKHTHLHRGCPTQNTSPINSAKPCPKDETIPCPTGSACPCRNSNFTNGCNNCNR